MKVTSIIDRLKSEVPAFGGRVGGSSAFDRAVADNNLPAPHAFVMPLDDRPARSDIIGSETLQDLEESFGIVVAVDNRADRPGNAAGDVISDLRIDILNALLGWEPSGEHGPFEYTGGSHLTMDRNRLWHQFDFVTTTTILES